VKTDQASIVADFLTPELHERQRQQQSLPSVDVRHVAGEDAASLTLLGVVDLRPPEPSEREEETPAPPLPSPARVVDYDWKSVIRENFMQLTQHVDPDSGLLNELLSRRVISHVSADVIKVDDSPVVCLLMGVICVRCACTLIGDVV